MINDSGIIDLIIFQSPTIKSIDQTTMYYPDTVSYKTAAKLKDKSDIRTGTH